MRLRDWTVLLLGGASGVGKTHVSYPLARRFDVGITEVDDFQIVLERMTDPARYPALHEYRRDPEGWLRLADDAKVASMVRYAETMALALEHVIANHLLEDSPLVLEGDFILPSLAARATFDGTPARGRVRGLLLIEDEEGIRANHRAREGHDQPGRARVSALYGEWLRRDAERSGVPVLQARPWKTVLTRAIAALEGTDERD